jgi:hypothetical protein
MPSLGGRIWASEKCNRIRVSVWLSGNLSALSATRSAAITNVATQIATSVSGQSTIGRAMRQMHSGIWQSPARNRRLNRQPFGDHLRRASAVTSRPEFSAGDRGYRGHRCLARDFLATWRGDSARERPGLGFLSALRILWAADFVDGPEAPRCSYDLGQSPGLPLRC